MGKHKGLSFYKRKKKVSSNLVKEIFSWIFGILTSIFLAYVIVFCVGMTTSVIGVSMEPGLYNGQTIFVNRFVYQIGRAHV